MAIMFPSRLPEEVTSLPQRASEVKVYEKLASQLNDEYHVFYSSPWLGTKPDGSEIDGEADFLVAHPQKGFLSIEVKGGRVEIDRNNEWSSTDRHGFKRRIKNPVNQARSSKHQLLKKLKYSSHWKPRFINALHGVILTDVSDPGFDLRPDMPREIFAFIDDLAHLDKWVDSRLDHAANGASALGRDGVFALELLLAKPIRLHSLTRSAIKEDMDSIRLKSDEQLWMLRDMEANNRMKFPGAAGTGKTILAIEKALMLARDGKSSLLLCFNNPLGRWLYRLLESENLIAVFTFDGFCRHVATAAQLDVTDQTIESLADGLIDNFANSNLSPFDAVIIDEGQDFSDQWLESLEIVVRDTRNGVFYVFYDDNQNVVGSGSNFLESLPVSTYRLTRNFRNTQAIFREADDYYRGIKIRAIGPEGLPVVHHKPQKNKTSKTAVVERIGTLIKNEQVNPHDIAVLLPDGAHLNQWMQSKGEQKLGPYAYSSADKTRGGFIRVDTVRRFKGLESPVVLLVSGADEYQSNEVSYTSLTRAQALLEIFKF
ncbi:NERD domain-containing protein [Akkermansiaceae bacterium]|nr:NERD domain-containing protein [Akkermansiaceae bacterium]